MEMIASAARTLNVGGRAYVASAAGDAVDAHPADVATLERYGFHPSIDLEELTTGELRSRATEAEIPGRSKMDREALIEALRTPDGQEA